MKVIIAGSRMIDDYNVVKLAIQSCIKRSPITFHEVVSGTAKGVDLLGERWAQENNIPVKRFPADWKKYGMKAGHIRNRAMADYVGPSPSGGLIAIWDGISKGTKGMIEIATRFKLKVLIARPHVSIDEHLF